MGAVSLSASLSSWKGLIPGDVVEADVDILPKFKTQIKVEDPPTHPPKKKKKRKK